MTGPSDPSPASRPTDPRPSPRPTDPPPGAKRAALAAEQAHLDAVHERVDELRRRARARTAAVVGEERGGTYQSIFERDVTAHHHATRAARLTFGDVESLAFGRLDLVAEAVTPVTERQRRDGTKGQRRDVYEGQRRDVYEGQRRDVDEGQRRDVDGRPRGRGAETFHIGRVSVIDEDGEVLLVDWRAPVAGAFYRATAAEPLGVVRRRTLTTRGRHVTDLDDELLDADAADRLGIVAVTGQGALLAALQRARTGHLRDIVATIQADQDRIIRTPATGTLVVAGGPGTGKTVVALHRVAYLLYEDRDRFEGRGILVVGPSAAFTEHTSRVLPALGEDRAVQRPLASLAPGGAHVDGWDEPEIAALKGDLRMVAVCRRLVRHAVPPLPPTTRVSFEGTTAVVEGRVLGRVRRKLLDRVRPDRAETSYHARRRGADEALRQALWRAWRATHRAAGRAAPEERRETEFDAALDGSASFAMLRRCWWPELDPVEVLTRLARGRLDLARLAGPDLDADAVARLRRAWADAEGWTVDDVALLDEVAALLGPATAADGVERRSGRGRGDGDGDGHPADGIRLTADRLRVEVRRADVADDAYRDFAHVVVDEAQDLSPMQWRAVARRGPYASWTIVGDLAQRSRTSEPSTWEEIAALIGRRQVQLTRLDVNYRTPSEIVAVARAVLEEAGLDPAAVPTSVRETGERPELHRTDDVVGHAARLVRSRLDGREGTVAVLAPLDLLGALREAVAARVPDVTERQDRVRVHDARTAKGLEFDDVILVRPDGIADASSVGMHQVYVAVTRATRSLAVVATPTSWVPGLDHLDRVVVAPV